jgi:hypothetical protein
MEFLTGEDLQHRLSRQEPMSLRRKLEVAAEICDGLSYAHRRGLVHRDVKPANIFITDEGVVKLLDFGLARMVASELTRSNMMMGTLNYMAPEQVRGERTDHRADIFSFGVVLYEMLSGRKAFQGDSFATTLYKILQEVPEPLNRIDPSLTPELVWLVEKALAKPRDERYQDLTDVGRDLAIVRQHLSDATAAPGMAMGAPRVPSDPPRTTPPPWASGAGTTIAAAPAQGPSAGLGAGPGSTPGSQSGTAKRPAWLLLGAALVILAVAAGTWFALKDARPATEQASAPAVEPPAAQPPASASPAPAPAPAPSLPPGPPADERPAPAAGDEPQHALRTADDARGRMARAKTAARQAGTAATASAAYAAASAAEREGNRLYQAKRLTDAAAKFYEASGLFRSAELTPAAPPPTRQEPARADPPSKPLPEPPAATAPPPAAAPPAVPSAENQVQLPPAPAPRVPQPAATQPPAKTPTITAAEGAASPPSDEGVRDLLKRYEQALESRSIEALKRLWPSLQGAQEDAVRSEFMHARRIEVDVEGTAISIAGASGTVTFVRRYQLVTVDNQKLIRTSRTTMTVRRAGSDWVIDAVRFEPIR